jgi:hypothetical protein
MCIYHEENPTVKQTEIGGKLTRSSMEVARADHLIAMFGVERRYE